MFARLVVVIVVGVGGAGCSALIGQAPSPAAWKSIDRRAVPPAKACTRTGALPYLEAGVAIVAGVMTAGLLFAESQSECTGEHLCLDGLGYALAIPTGLIATGTGLSAARGFDVNEKCGRYHESWNAKWGGGPSR